MEAIQFLGAAAAVLVGFFLFMVLVTLRRVVPTNQVHIVNSSGSTTSYGKGLTNGSTYYAWPAWMPFLGVVVSTLPVSVFDLTLDGYEAYDKDRLPFIVDVTAFFRVKDTNLAAQRVSSFAELHAQLTVVVQGAVRSVLANAGIDTIMSERSIFGDKFTQEVNENLANWGVETVKNLELMDIQDGHDSKVIQNIMAKKKSHVDMESRTEVAKNRQLAEIAEVDSARQVSVQKQAAAEEVGMRTVQANQAVKLAEQTAEQQVKEAARITKEKEMAIVQVQVSRETEIKKQATIIEAQALQSKVEIASQADLTAAKNRAEGTKAEGLARAESEKAIMMAPVAAQTALAKEIGENQGYQEYLITIRKVEAAQAVGVAQADALTKADIKVISNVGTPTEGLTSVMDIFSSKGGLAIGGMLEAMKNTDTGAAVLKAVGVEGPVKH